MYDCCSCNSKYQVDALRTYYGQVKSTREAHIAKLEFLSNFIIPLVAISFIAFYWFVGLMMYYAPEMFDSFLAYDVETF